MNVPMLAGIVSTTIFAVSLLPMVVKAGRTKNLASYSASNIVLSNVGNAVHSVYVFSMPVGPIWLLHSFYLVSSALMLLWYVQYVVRLAWSSPLGQPTGVRQSSSRNERVTAAP